jgi:hypothetical protein
VRLTENVVIGDEQVRVVAFGDRGLRRDQPDRLRTRAQRNLAGKLGLDDLVVLRRVSTKGRYLDDFTAGEQDVREPEPAPDDAAVPKEVPYLVRACTRRDVEVLGLATQHQVADAPTNQVRGVAVAVETSDHLGGVWIDQTSRNLMGIDNGFGRIFGERGSLFIIPLTEVGIYHSGHRIPMGPEKRRALKLFLGLSKMRP